MGNRADPVLKSQPAGDHDGLHSHELGGGLPPPPTKPTVTHMHNHEPGGWLPPPPTGSTVTHMHSHHQMALDIKQDAQLSHRDFAAGCVIVLAEKVEAWNWETIFPGHYGCIFNQCDIIGLKICQIW